MPPEGTTCGDQNVIRPDVATRDGCDIVGRIKALTIPRGLAGVLEWQFTNDRGQPISLTDCLAACDPQSSSSESSESSAASEDAEVECTAEQSPSVPADALTSCPDGTCAPTCGAVVRASEAAGTLPSEIYECPLTVVDAATGTVRWRVPKTISDMPAVYAVEWAVNDPCGRPILINQSFLIVESGLFGLNTMSSARVGPPTIDEIRLVMRDSGPEDNPLLEDVEFSDSEIMYALVRPIRQFHELPPPLRVHVFNTKRFPWREHWIKAAVGHLYQAAAAFYRRNRLKHSSGGMNLDDRNKETEYNNAADRMLGEWLNFVQQKKVSCNAAEAMGTVESTYGAFYSGL